MKKVVSFILSLMLVMPLAGGAVAEDFSVSDYVNPFTGNAYTEESFYGNGTIIIILSHECSINWREYTIADFPELDLESVVTHEPMSDDKEFIESNPEYRNFVDITLKDKSNKAVIEAIELLYKRNYNNYSGDIHMALPMYRGYYDIIEPEQPIIDPVKQEGSGDVNGDSDINLTDVTSILKYIAGWKQNVFFPYFADLNGDDEINIKDVTMLLKKIAGWNADNIGIKAPSDELLRQIEDDYTAYCAENYKFGPEVVFQIIRYYGSYDGAVPVMFIGKGVDYIAMEVIEEVAGSIFHYPDGNTIVVWKNGEFFSMKEAYEQGILTKEQVADIAYPRADEVIDYEITIFVNPPSDELLQRIEEDYTAYLVEKGGYDPEIDGRYPVMYYYGMFNECVPIMFMEPEMGVYTTVTVAGAVFHYDGSNTIRVWKNGDFFSMEEAYEQGLLTKKQVAAIADIHNGNNYFEFE